MKAFSTLVAFLADVSTNSIPSESANSFHKLEVVKKSKMRKLTNNNLSLLEGNSALAGKI